MPILPAMDLPVLTVCNRSKCRRNGSEKLLARLVKFLRRRCGEGGFEVREGRCQGSCGGPPSVLVESDGVQYAKVRPKDAKALVKSHVKRRRALRRLRPKLWGKGQRKKAA